MHLAHLARYPVKSMRGESLPTAQVGFQGIPGDRIYAFVQERLHTPFPWLTGRECPALLQHQPAWQPTGSGRPALVVHTPAGETLPIESDELRLALEAAAGTPIRLHADHRGNHDIAYVSLITTATVEALAAAASVPPDHRRFRMNIIVEAPGFPAFAEREWVGHTIRIGEVTLAVTEQDRRCQMITLDPETGEPTPSVLKSAGQLNDAFAGVYASVLTPGTLTQGDPIEVI